MLRDDAYLYDILESARAILTYMRGKDRVSIATQQKYDELPWQAMKGTRNKVIHEYDAIQLDIIWDIVQKDLPARVSELEKIVPSL